MRSYRKSVTGASPSVKATCRNAPKRLVPMHPSAPPPRIGTGSGLLARRMLVSSAMHRLPASLFAGVAAALVGGPFLVVALPPAAAFAFAALWGVVFGFIAAGLHDEASVGGALVLGIVIALTADIVDFAFVPATVSAATSFLAHVAFGATFVLAPFVFRLVTATTPGYRRRA
jgi:hypothetical protein